MELETIKGLGPKNITLLNKLNIFSIEDLIEYYPFRYDIMKRTSLDQPKVIIDGIVESMPLLYRFRNINKMSFKLNVDSKIINVVIYNRAFLKNNITIGKWVTVIGKFDKNTLTAASIELSKLDETNLIRPIYHTVNGITSKIINKYVNCCFSLIDNTISDNIPSFICEKYHFLDKRSALYNIHNPSNEALLKSAMIRLKYEELFYFMVRINYLKMNNEKENGIIRKISVDDRNSFLNTLPFSLTMDQISTLDSIIEDLNSKKRMNRLVQGDVGSGKTVVAIGAMYFNYLNNYQSAMMAPTEILANQHYLTIKRLLPNINIEILTSSTSKKEKSRILKELESGDINIIVGTHALISSDVKYYNLGLVITDEQHRFGVSQRGLLSKKGIVPDVLYLSATPIPRTYALTIYGDMDVSSIKTMPEGRRKVKTYLKTNSEIKDVLSMMYNELSKKHQVFVVAPLIQDENTSSMENVVSLKEKMEKAFGKYFKIGLLHGKMKSSEKDSIMEDFKNNNINILISTTVIEVGVDIPNATMMVIFDAEKFGLATLHQLRGRVGRNDLDSYCILISDQGKERLQIMTTTNDGFEISEKDFLLRGHGDLFGVRQSGDMVFKIANIRTDYKILMQAKKDVEECIKDNRIDINSIVNKNNIS